MTTLRVASCGQSFSNVVMTVMLTFQINFYKTANGMEDGNLPYFIYKTANKEENGNLVVVFLYLRHIIDLMVKPAKPVG